MKLRQLFREDCRSALLAVMTECRGLEASLQSSIRSFERCLPDGKKVVA